MKTARTEIYEFIQQETYRESVDTDGITTKKIAEALGMHRPNVSAILNELVKDGKLIKTATRPVYYKLAEQKYQGNEKSCFSEMIGHYGSLRNDIQLAKAAILYPRSSLNVLLSSKSGCGTTYFASLMFQFAKEQGVLTEDAKFVDVDCRHYYENVSLLDDILFGVDDDINDSCFVKASGGMLLIDHVDLLDAKQLSRIYGILESGKIYNRDKSAYLDCGNILLVLSCQPQSKLQLSRIIPMVIELPELKERPMRERYELINHFFRVEALNSDRSIVVTADVLKALMISRFENNVKGMELEIKSACANAYVRVVNELDQDIRVVLNDFKRYIRRSLINLKGVKLEIDAIIGDQELFVYDKDMCNHECGDGYLDEDMYLEIKRRYDELADLGISDASIESVMDNHITNLFKKYRYHNGFDTTSNLEQLSRIVDERVIGLVKEFLNLAQRELGHDFKENVFYGLCLHINSLLTSNLGKERVNNDKVVKIVEEYPKEYAASAHFTSILKEELGLDLPIHEVVLIAMFLIDSGEGNEDERPVLLYIMHGSCTASSLKNVTNSLTHCDNAYSYDLKLGMDTDQAIEEIKILLQEIDCNKGVIVIYDMGSIKTMLETIAEEIDIKIRYINIPITLIGIDVARKCTMERDVDYVYHQMNMEMKNMMKNEESRADLIITLCHTGEGGAMQLKRYIDQYSKLGMKTKALAISDRDELIREVMELQKIYHIHSFVGTFDPKILGIPFISISKIFENSKSNLDRILMFEPMNSNSFDYVSVYNYLEEHFVYASIPKLKSILPGIVDEIGLMYNINDDQKCGLFMHLACLVERLLEGKKVAKNSDKDRILAVFGDDYQTIRKILKKLEKAFKVIIDDEELATIIMIIKKI